MSETLQRRKPYPLGDRLSAEEASRLGVNRNGQQSASIMGVWDGEPARAPRKGERYLSGDIIAAYRAGEDLVAYYHIARLVKRSKAL